MNPIHHPRTSITLGAPAGWDHSQTECVGLPVAQIESNGMPVLESYWQPSADERAAIAAGMPVVLQVVGLNHPVVSLGAVLPPEGVRPSRSLDLIAEWRRGCSNAPASDPAQCSDCTRALIDALERAAVHEQDELTEALRYCEQATAAYDDFENAHRLAMEEVVRVNLRLAAVKAALAEVL